MLRPRASASTLPPTLLYTLSTHREVVDGGIADAAATGKCLELPSRAVERAPHVINAVGTVAYVAA